MTASKTKSDGYRKSEENKNQLVVDEFAASAAKIASELNRLGMLSPLAYKISRGLPHPKGGFSDSAEAKWSATSIICILKDETYIGTLVQGRHGTYNYKIKDVVNKPSDQWERVTNSHKSIIRKHDFDLVQKIMGLDTRTTLGGDRVHLYSGILICGCCGARMTRKSVPYKGKSYYYYYCPTGKKKGCEKPVMLKEEDLTDCVLRFLQAHIQNVVSPETLLQSIDEETINQQQLERCKEQIADNDAQLQKVTHFKTTLYENFVNRFITNEEYKGYKDAYDDEFSELKAAIDALRREMAEVENNGGERLKWTHHFKIKEAELEETLYQVISKQAQVILNIEDISDIGKLTALLSKKTEYQTQVKELTQQKMRFYEAFLQGSIDQGEYNRLKAPYDTELERLKQLHTIAATAAAKMQERSAQWNTNHTFAKEIVSTGCLTAALADALIDKVYVYPNNHLEIVWKMNDFIGGNGNAKESMAILQSCN